MLTPLALFLSLLVATAFIAHWSDNLGKKLGKKRVSVFGLRPRTSATLLTVVSSWAIMAFTLAALLLTVAPLKTALFSYDAARASFKADLKIAQAKTDDVQRNYASTSAKLNEASTKLSEANSKLNEASANLNKANAKLNEASTNLNKANQAKDRAEQGVKTAVKNQRAAQQAEQTARSGERTALAAASAASSQAKTARISLVTLNRDLDQKEAELHQKKNDLAEAQTNFKRVSGQARSLTVRVNDLQNQVKARQNLLFVRGGQIVRQDIRISRQEKELGQGQFQLKQTRTQLAQARTQLSQTQREVSSLTKQQVQLKADALFIASSASALAYHDIALPVDQTLTEQRLPSRLSPEEARSQLRALLERSQEAARNFLQNNDNGSLAKVVEVVPLGAYEDNGKTVYLNPDQWLKAYSDIIAKQKDSVLLRMVVSSNYSSDTLKNFPFVEARLLFVPQAALYEKNQLICEGTIDGTQGEASIYGALTNLIEVARRHAVSHGASPPLSPEAPTFFASDTGERIFGAISQVQKAGRRIPVRIVAARDLNTAEPLQIRFQLGDSSTA